MSGYNTFAAWEKDNRNFEENAALAKVMAKYGVKEGDYISNGRRIVAVYRPDLSYKPDFKLGEYKYFNVRTVHFRMGSGPEETYKILSNAVQKGNLDRRWVAYEAAFGAPMNTYLFLLPAKTAAEWDTPPNQAFMAALRDAHWEEAVEKTVISGEDRLFSFNPRLSFVPESVAALDPAFWHPEARPAKSEAARKGTTQ